MSILPGPNPKDRFSHDKAYIKVGLGVLYQMDLIGWSGIKMYLRAGWWF